MNDTLLRLRHAATAELVPDRNARRLLAVAAFAVATALSASVEVPVPFSPVPITLQTLMVVLSGALLGPGLGAASQLTYLAAGAAGLPVFAGGAFGLWYLMGPTGGYLLAFPLAAWAAGRLAGNGPGRGVLRLARLYAGLFVASLLILLGGASWLAAVTGDPAGALQWGVLPFLAGDAVKVGMASLIAWRGRDRTLGLL